MAAETKDDIGQDGSQVPKSAGGSRKKMILAGVVVGVMLVEAVVVFALVKSLAATTPVTAEAAPAHGEAGKKGGHKEGNKEKGKEKGGHGEAKASSHGLNPAGGERAPGDAEVEVVKFRAQNEKSQRILSYDFEVYATVSGENAETFQEIVKNKVATIKDQFTRIVRAADPQRFAEPDLATLRSQFKSALAQVADDDKMVLEVLIPSIASYSD